MLAERVEDMLGNLPGLLILGSMAVEVFPEEIATGFLKATMARRVVGRRKTAEIWRLRKWNWVRRQLRHIAVVVVIVWEHLRGYV